MSVSLPDWVRWQTAPNPGPMTLEGTNTWILGTEELLVIDPGPLDESHLLDIALHGTVAHIVLTHGHTDHSAGVQRLHELTGAPVSAWDPAFVHGGEALRHAMTLEVGQVRAVVHHTPGHSADSVSLVASLSGPDDVVVLTGDTVLGRGTAVIADPDGDLGDYLNSLEVLLGLVDAPVLPGHGPVGGRLRQRVEEYQRHRQERLEQVRHAVAQGARTAEEVVAAVYTEVADDLREAAHMSARAHLRHLGVPH